jgi:predicted metalloprotease with PDZ domain
MGESAPRPRLCHIVKWPDFEGYGFNLHAEKNRPGQYIGKVDPDSPADVAGLREGDKIVEVSRRNFVRFIHQPPVVTDITENSSETIFFTK